jgi:protoporphyrin/coproporphyrin ferrochelatase
MGSVAYLLVNFGGPRDLLEIRPFLKELLTDQEVIRTSYPPFFHKLLFSYVAKRRAKKIAPDYALIGGKSPIFEDTEAIAQSASAMLGRDVLTFHRYLPSTHHAFMQKMEGLEGDQIRVFPLFPQFSYATTGSIALWFKKNLSLKAQSKMSWVKSYAGHPSYIAAMEKCLRNFMNEKGVQPSDTMILCSAHGLPKSFISTGDIYEEECRLSFELLKSRFPGACFLLSFQSQFGKQEWIRPYTLEVCKNIQEWAQGCKNVIVVPLSFTSDHIETLYEIEELYLPLICKSGLNAFRCPALNRRLDWIEAIAELLQGSGGLANPMLIRK